MAARNFTRGEILTIRRLAAEGASAPSISALFPEVGVETLRRIIRRETYREIGEVAPELERKQVVARLEGEMSVPEAKKSELQRRAEESLAELSRQVETPEKTQDPVQEFLEIRREGVGKN